MYTSESTKDIALVFIRTISNIAILIYKRSVYFFFKKQLVIFQKSDLPICGITLYQ